MSNQDNNHQAGAEGNPIRNNLHHQFAQLTSEEPAPEALKEEVFDTLDTIHLLADVMDLFTVKFGNTEAEFLDLLDSDELFSDAEE